MNKVLLSIIFAIFAKNIISHSQILAEKDVFEEMECYPKVLNSYLSQNELDTYSTFESSRPTELLSSTCLNMDNSCCSDEVFTEMYTQTSQKVQKISEVMNFFKNSIELLTSANNEKIEILKKKLSEEDFSIFESVLNEVKTNKDEFLRDINDATNFTLNTSSGLSCAICSAYNHHNLVEGNHSAKIVLDSEFCRNAFSSSEFEGFVDLLLILQKLNQVTHLVFEAYELDESVKPDDVPINDDFKSTVMQKKISCLAESDLSSNESCLELCFEIAPFNKFFLHEYSDNILWFGIIVDDFFGDQSVFKSEKKEFVAKYSSILKFGRIEEFLPLTDEDSPLNLSHMKAVLKSNEGWNLSTQGMKTWSRYFESQMKLVVSTVALFLFMKLD